MQRTLPPRPSAHRDSRTDPPAAPIRIRPAHNPPPSHPPQSTAHPPSQSARTARKPFVQPATNRAPGPSAVRHRTLTRCVRKPMHQLHPRRIRPPTAAATRGSSPRQDRPQSSRGRSGTVGSRSRRHRRYASVSPPSTGISAPSCSGACGPPRNRIASAQSFGSIGTCVSVRFA